MTSPSTIPQTVIILRGGPAVGKTTLAKALRNRLGNAISIQIDEIIKMIGAFEDFHAKKWGLIGARHLAGLYVEHGWHVIFEEMYLRQLSIRNTQRWATQHRLPNFLFHLTAQQSDLVARNTALGRDVLTEEQLITLTQMAEASIPTGATIMNTSKYSIDECVEIIISTIQQCSAPIIDA